jgi:hypothetical protein
MCSPDYNFVTLRIEADEGIYCFSIFPSIERENAKTLSISDIQGMRKEID